MAGVMPSTYQEQLMKLMQSIATAKAAPDANLDELSSIEQQILASIRKPMDTAATGSPAANASMNLSNGASAPPGGPAGAPGGLPPMIAALLAQQGGGAPAGPPPGMATPSPAAPGSFPTHGLMASAPPNMDEVRRMLHPA